MTLHLPIGPLKTRFGFETVPRCEPNTYQSISDDIATALSVPLEVSLLIVFVHFYVVILFLFLVYELDDGLIWGGGVCVCVCVGGGGGKHYFVVHLNFETKKFMS